MVIREAKRSLNRKREGEVSMLARSSEWDVVEKSEFLGLWKCLHNWGGIEQSDSGVQSSSNQNFSYSMELCVLRRLLARRFVQGMRVNK